LLLTNGCSTSAAYIIDAPSTENWTKFLGEKLDLPVVNLAENGKNNFRIIEETSRYIINALATNTVINTCVVQLSCWKRDNYFKQSHSFTWLPDDLDSQLYTKDCFVKLSGIEAQPMMLFRTEKDGSTEMHRCGDDSLVYDIITQYTFLFLLQELCKSNNISLYFFTMNGWPDILDDPVIRAVDDSKFLFINKTGDLRDHLVYEGIQEVGQSHVIHNGHKVLSSWLFDLIKTGKRIDNTTQTIDGQTPEIYDYT
tara:strand:+ start:759 stop:1520 length:762 start_codon:yes stop_codon:yes gene_type:complete